MRSASRPTALEKSLKFGSVTTSETCERSLLPDDRADRTVHVSRGTRHLRFAFLQYGFIEFHKFPSTLRRVACQKPRSTVLWTMLRKQKEGLSRFDFLPFGHLSVLLARHARGEKSCWPFATLPSFCTVVPYQNSVLMDGTVQSFVSSTREKQGSSFR